MKKAILLYDKELKKWKHKDDVYSVFIDAIFKLSSSFDILGWCYFPEDENTLINIINRKEDFLPEMITFGSHLFGENTEYLESSNVYFNSFSKDEKETYDTWRIRSNTGFISASILKELIEYKFPKTFRASLAVLSFSAHKIGGITSVSFNKNLINKNLRQLNKKEYGVFISYSKKKKWLLFYLITNFIFEKNIFIPFTLFFKNNWQDYKTKPKIWEYSLVKQNQHNTKLVDVIIPTLGRPNFVFNTLKNIDKQDFKIDRVHLIEQKLPGQKSTLLEQSLSKNWSFNINHLLLEKLGLCNARNIGFKESKADYIIMFDDDILIDLQPKLVENLIKKLEISKSKIISFASNNKKENAFIEMSYFVSGCSFMIKNNNIPLFNTQIEGMGVDDQEYNFNIRQKYERVVFTNSEYINHLKAPMGGWRFDAKSYLPWYHDNDIDVLPGVATMYRYLKFATVNQIKGYKLFTFHRYYGVNIFKYFTFNKKWKKSISWAKKVLKDKVKIDVSKGVKKK